MENEKTTDSHSTLETNGDSRDSAALFPRCMTAVTLGLVGHNVALVLPETRDRNQNSDKNGTDADAEKAGAECTSS